MKGALRYLSNHMENLREDMANNPECRELADELQQCRADFKAIEAKVPERWDWRENVTDHDRKYHAAMLEVAAVKRRIRID